MALKINDEQVVPGHTDSIVDGDVCLSNCICLWEPSDLASMWEEFKVLGEFTEKGGAGTAWGTLIARD